MQHKALLTYAGLVSAAILLFQLVPSLSFRLELNTTSTFRGAGHEEFLELAPQVPATPGWHRVDETREAMWAGREIEVHEERSFVSGQGGLQGLFFLAIPFALFAALVTTLSRRRLTKEILAGTVIGCVVQLILWLNQTELNVDVLLSGTLVVAGREYYTVPAIVFILVAFTTCALTAQTAGAIAVAIQRSVAKKMRCGRCATIFELDSVDTRCPKCAYVNQAMGVQWSPLIIAATLTAVGFVVFLLYAGPALGMLHRCQEYPPSDECQQLTWSAGDEWIRFDVDMAEFVSSERGVNFLHRWKFLLWVSGLLFIAPLLVAWLSRRKALATAGVLIPLNWALVTVLAFFLVVAGPNGRVRFIQQQALALLIWSIAGFVGAMVGNWLRGLRSSELILSELD